MDKKRDSFAFKRTYFDLLEGLGSQAKLEVLEAIFEYVFNENQTTPKNNRAKTVWKTIKKQLDTNAKKRDGVLKRWSDVNSNYDSIYKQSMAVSISNLPYIVETPPQKPKNKPVKTDVFADFAGDDKQLLRTLRDFNEMRTRIKHPMTDKARTMLCNKLRKHDRSQWIAILEQSIYAGWQDIYDLKQPEPQQNKRMEFPKL